MPDTTANIPLPAGVWVDLYAESGITIGVQINVENVGSNITHLVAVASSPELVGGFRTLRLGEEKTNDVGDSGAWSFSTFGTSVNVKVV